MVLRRGHGGKAPNVPPFAERHKTQSGSEVILTVGSQTSN